MAQLFVSAVEVSATTLTSTVPVSDSWAAAGKALGSLGQTVVSRLSPQEGTEVSISRVYQVNSALLAASSPYLRHIIQQPPQLQHLVPGLASVASRHRPRKLVAVLVQPHHVAAAEAVVKFIFTNDIALTSAQQALDGLLVAEQLQVCKGACWALKGNVGAWGSLCGCGCRHSSGAWQSTAGTMGLGRAAVPAQCLGGLLFIIH